MNTNLLRVARTTLLAAALLAPAGAALAVVFTQTPGGPELASGANLVRGNGALYKIVSDRIYKTTNNGQTWAETAGRAPAKPSQLAIIGSAMFIATNQGVLRSDDDGLTWTDFDGSGAGALSFSPTRLFSAGGALFASGTDPAFNTLVYKTGSSNPDWRNVTPPGLGNNGINGVVNAGSNLCLLIINNGLRYTGDGGETWSSATGLSGSFQSIGASPDGSTVYVANSGNVSRSTNSCQSFTFAGSAIGGLTGGLVRALGVDSAGLVFAGLDDGRIRTSSNNGGAWDEANSGTLPPGTGLSILQFETAGSGMLVATGGLGVHFRGAGNWQARNIGLKGAAVGGLQPLVGTNAFLVAAGGVQQTSDGGATYAPRNAGLPALGVGRLARMGDSLVASVFISGNGTQPPGIAVSTDGGASWTGLTSASGFANGAQIGDVLAAGGAFYASVGFGGGVWKSADGLSWTQMNSGLPANPSLRNLAARGSTLFAYVGGQGVYRSTDGAASWQNVSFGSTTSLSGTLFGKVFASSGAVFASAGGVIYRSTDDGADWTRTTGNALSRFGIEILSLAEDANGHLYLGDEHAGLSISKDGGLTWTPDSDGLHLSGVCIERINGLIVKDGKVYAGQGEGGGVMVANPIGSGTPGDSVACTTDTDIFPNAFSFTAQNNVPPGTPILSNLINVSGLGSGVSVPVTVEGGDYAIGADCSSGFTGAAGTVTNGDFVCVRHTSAAVGETATSTRLTIGDQSALFTSRTGLVFTGRDDEINTGFGTNGFANAAGLSAANDLVILGDGRIAVAGLAMGSNFQGNFGMALFNANGTLASGFGNNGVVIRDLGGQDNVVRVLALPSGKFVLVGYSVQDNGTPTNGGDDFTAFALVRLNADGTPDNGFGNGGTVLFDIHAAASNRIEVVGDAVLAPDGSILVSGGVLTSSTGAMMIAVRFSQDGIVDTAFGNNDAQFADGVASVNVGSNFAEGNAALVQPDGKIVIAGRTQLSFSSVDGAVVRLNTDGTLDTGFGGGGKAYVGAGLWDAAMVSGGRILVVGEARIGNVYQPIVARLNADGTLDTSYDGDGVFAFSALTGRLSAIEPLADGRIAVAGSALRIGSGEEARMLYAVLTAGAGLDASFGPEGQGYVLRGPVNGSSITGNALQQRADGGVVVGGIFGSGLGVFVFGGEASGPGPDTTPDAFAFTAQSGVEPLAIVQSNTVTIGGIDAPAPISVVGGEYSIGCTSNFTATAATIGNGQSVCLRHTAAMAFNATTTTTLTIGGVSAGFASTTRAADTTPDAFAFGDMNNVAQGALVTSNAVTIGGIETAVPVTVTGGEYSIGCSTVFTSAAGSIANGQSVCVRHTAANAPEAATSTTLDVNGVSDTFTSTTAGTTPVDTTPDAFQFTDATDVAQSAVVTSNSITISGIDAPAPISVSGGEYSLGCDAQGFMTAQGQISNGQSVCVRHTAAGAAASATSTTLSVNGVSDTFTSTTAADTGGSSGTVNDPSGQPLTISTAIGTLTNLRAVVQPTFAPGGLGYPHGFIAFDITGLPAGGTATITIALPTASGVNAYVKCSGTTCVELPNASVQFAGQTLTLSLVDGGPYDADGLVNGVIQDPGAPAIKAVNNVSITTSGGGALGAWTLLGLLPALALRRRRARGAG